MFVLVLSYSDWLPSMYDPFFRKSVDHEVHRRASCACPWTQPKAETLSVLSSSSSSSDQSGPGDGDDDGDDEDGDDLYPFVPSVYKRQ